MRRLWLLAIAALLLFASPASAQPPPAPEGATEGELKVSARRVSPGEEVTASGEGCGREVAVQFKLYAPDLISTSEIPSSDTGYFEGKVQIPSETPPGRAWLVTQCSNQLEQIVLEQTILVTRPAVVITGVNLMFGGGVFLIFGGVGVMLRRQLPSRRRRRVVRSP